MYFFLTDSSSNEKFIIIHVLIGLLCEPPEGELSEHMLNNEEVCSFTGACITSFIILYS